MSDMRHRPRRLRATPALRSMFRETRVSPKDLVYPMFVRHGEGVADPIASMPGLHQLSIDRAVEEAASAAALLIPAVLLFGIPAVKDAQGTESFAADGIIQRAVAEIKRQLPDLVVITDVCLCEYTDHGHCGLLNGTTRKKTRKEYPEGYVLNDETLDTLRLIAVSHAESGADIVAPSGMIDGMVGSIRDGLDGAGFDRVPIMSYAVKYASAYYGPFRDAAEGAPKHGDRKSHQMDPANAREALREVDLDVDEGADILMVKPALAYLDVVNQTRRQYPEMPLAAYNVSGEYAMVKAAAAKGWIDERAVVIENLTAIKRAGADIVITYHAKDAAEWLRT
ncbi:MAG: porphobilinogen synthase [Gemmatimonadetes bacterium]|nr:porphobilinogen synthase [Gemmatimonadota bacterium]